MFVVSVLLFGGVLSSPSHAFELSCVDSLQNHKITVSSKSTYRVPRTLRFMSYNVLNLFVHSGRYIWGEDGQVKTETDAYKGQKKEEHTKEIARIIHDTNPDFILLQEVEGRSSLDRFTQNYLGGEYVAFMPPTNDRREIGVALLIKDDLKFHIKVESFESLSWTNPRGHIEPIFTRNVGLFSIFDPDTDEVVLGVFGLHFKSRRDRRGDPGSVLKRTKEVEETVRAVEKFRLAHPGVPVIVAGDFNSNRDVEELKPLFDELGLHDAHTEEHFRNKDRQGRITHSYHPVGEKAIFSEMDLILVDESLKSRILGSDVYRYRDYTLGKPKPIPDTINLRNLNPSDHFPVFVDLDPKSIYKLKKE